MTAEAVTLTPTPTAAEAGVKVVVVIFESKNCPLVNSTAVNVHAV